MAETNAIIWCTKHQQDLGKCIDPKCFEVEDEEYMKLARAYAFSQTADIDSAVYYTSIFAFVAGMKKMKSMLNQ